MNTKNNLEVLEPEVEEIPLEQVINTALVKANVTDQVIASLKEKYSGMQLRDIEDKETYLDIVQARKEVRKVGIITEQLCKKGREDAIKEQKLWLAKQSEVLGKINEIQSPLDSEIEKFESEVERKEVAEKKRQESIFIHRQAELFKLGATYDDGSMVLNHISYETELLRKCDDDQWNDTVLPKYKKEYEVNQALIVEQEGKRKAEMEQAKKEREQFAAQQEEFKEQQALFAQQQQELKKQMDDAEREKRLVQEHVEAEERKKKQELVGKRINQIGQLGLRGNGRDKYETEDVCVFVEDIQNMTDLQWDTLIADVTPVIEKSKKEAEEKRIIEFEQQKQSAIQKALEDEKIKKQQEEQRKADDLAKSGDKARWLHFLGQLNAIQIPPMNSGIYRGKIGILKEKMEEINNL